MDPVIQIITAPAVSEFAKIIFTEFINPKLADLKKYFQDSTLQDHEIGLHLEKSIRKYLLRTKNSIEILDSLIADTAQIPLEQVYVPIRLLESGTNTEIEINSGIEFNFENNRNRILIIGEGGIGKSTVLRIMGLQTFVSMRLCPILVNLRDLSSSHTLLDEIFRQFTELGEAANKEIIIKLLESGKFLLLLDAVDEILVTEKTDVLMDIRDFIQKASNNTFIISSRDDRILTSLTDFRRYILSNLDENQIKILYENYDKITGNNIAEKLWISINSVNLKSFLLNPIIASMLYNVYYFDNRLPSRSVELVMRIYNIYLFEHDYSKCGFTRTVIKKLASPHIKGIYSLIAFQSLQKGTPKLLTHELETMISDYLKENQLDFNDKDVLNELVISCILFTKQGADYVWQHKKFQEYFAANYICTSRQKLEIVNFMLTSERKLEYIDIFLNILEMDRALFEQTVLNKILEMFIDHCQGTYNNCIGIRSKMLELRRAVTFGRKTALYAPNEENPNDWWQMQKDFINFSQSEITELSNTGKVQPDFWLISSVSLEARVLMALYHHNFDLFRIIPSSKISNRSEDANSIIVLQAENKMLDQKFNGGKGDREVTKLNIELKKGEITPLTHQHDDQLNIPFNFSVISKLMLQAPINMIKDGNRILGYFYPDFEKCQLYRAKIISGENNHAKSLLSGL